MERKKKELETYFNTKIQECSQAAASLMEDERKDDADFEKIRGNIYDIFLKMFHFALRTTQEKDKQAVAEVFYQKLEVIPAAWKVSLAKAKEHDDTAKCYIEELKLDIVEEIRSEFHRIWEEEA